MKAIPSIHLPSRPAALRHRTAVIGAHAAPIQADSSSAVECDRELAS